MDLFIQDENDKNKFNCIDDKKVINEINNVARLAMHTSLHGKDQNNLTRGPATPHSKYKKETLHNHGDMSFCDWMK